MALPREQGLADVLDIRTELFQILDGMEDVLDWRTDEESWSAREVITHMLYTPPGGVPAILKEILEGTTEEYDLWADQKYLSDEAKEWTLGQAKEELSGYLDSLEEELEGTTDTALAETSALVHQRNRHWDEPRPALWLVERLFAGHWREHLVQLKELKAASVTQKG